MPGGVAPKFGSEKVSRYTGVSQLQLRVSRYTVQLRIQLTPRQGRVSYTPLFAIPLYWGIQGFVQFFRLLEPFGGEGWEPQVSVHLHSTKLALRKS